MSIATFLAAKKNDFGPKEYSIKCTKNVAVKMKDEVSLLCDIYFPQGNEPFPTILIRTPYLRKGFATFAKIFAERGFITVLQACRGTDGSGGEVEPLTCEREDGLATLKWLNLQNWFDGQLGTTGPSYLGYVQWAICDEMPENSALSTHIATADYRDVLMPKGSIDLQLWLSWMQLINGLEKSPLKTTFRILTGKVEKRTVAAANTIPLIDADIAATGEKMSFWRQWVNKDNIDKKYWDNLDQTKRLNGKTPPNFFVTGWYDFMINQTINDYQTLKKAKTNPYLTIGPWYHINNKLVAEGVRSTLVWMRAHLKNDYKALRKKPVRIHISGLDEWREYESYPPKGQGEDIIYLGSDGVLLEKTSAKALPATYRYDPHDPTPNLAGGIFAFTGAGVKDNRKLEARDDVLTFTSKTLDKKTSIIGQVKLKLFARSNLEYTDFFARLCDVSPSGKSINICDGFERLTPGKVKKNKQGIWQIEIILSHTAHQFKKGHRLRLQVSSGAAPKISRNPGTAESILTASEMKAADQEIFFDKNHPSAIYLPIYNI